MAAQFADLLKDVPSSPLLSDEEPVVSVQPLARTFKTLLPDDLLTDRGFYTISSSVGQLWLIDQPSGDTVVASKFVWAQGYRDRLDALRDAAGDEGIVFSEESAEAASRFLFGLSHARRPGVFLLDNGHVRLVWSDEGGQQAAFEFLPAGDVRFVTFRRRSGRDYPTAGVAPAAAVLEQAGGHWLARFIRA